MPPNTSETAASLVINLFGPMQVFVQGRPSDALRSRKTLWLLALLALRQGRPVEREWLAGTLWPDADKEQSLSSLRSVLSELRKAMNGQGERLKSPNRHSLFLDLNGAAVDVLEFDATVVSDRPSALQHAVALYRGPLLEGCAEEWVAQERDVREQACLRALESLADASLAAGDWKAAADHSWHAVSMDPWRDGARRSLMAALAGGGDINAALQVYREFVALLREDPRAVPDKQTTSLYRQLRSEARRLASGTGAEGPTRAEPTVRGYLPRPLTDLVGREDESEEVAALLRRSRLVTLTGPGGIGKTRLALSVAGEAVRGFADGVWLVALDAVADGARVPAQIAGVFGLKEEPGRTPLECLTVHLRERRLLLVLDNCEHLLDASAQVAGHLLRECAGLRVLTTSREALGMTGETVWPVPGLSVPDPALLPARPATLVRVLIAYEGVQLFVERAQAVQKGFELTRSNAATVAQVCARLEGIPLAIELAAARARGLTVAQIAERLDDYLRLLTGKGRAGVPRHQTLRGTLDWSYALLTVPEQLLLARVSVFSGGWRLEAAEAVCSGRGIDAEWVSDLLTSLADKSLLMFDASEGRYRLLEMVQQYAAERLSKDNLAELRTRHRDWFLARADEADRFLRGPDQAVWLHRLDLEERNLRAALAWDGAGPEDAERGLRLAGALWWYWNIRGRFDEGRRFLSAAMEREGACADTEAYARALNGAGALAHNQGDQETSRAFHEKCLPLFRALGDHRGAASALNHLGNVADALNDFATARERYTESLCVYQEINDRQGVAIVLQSLGRLARLEGDNALAQSLYRESLHIRRELGDLRGVAQMLASLGNVARMQGDYAAAHAFLEESVSLCRELGDRQSLGFALSHLGSVAVVLGNYASARALYEESLGIRRELGEKPSIAWSLINLGMTAFYEGRLPPARALFEESLGLFRELGNSAGIAWSLNHLGDVSHALGDDAAALENFARSLVIFRDLGAKDGVAEGLADFAAVCASQADPLRAACLWGGAEALCESIGAALPPVEQETYRRDVAQAREAVGEDAFAAAWEEGRALTWERAVEYALGEAGETFKVH